SAVLPVSQDGYPAPCSILMRLVGFFHGNLLSSCLATLTLRAGAFKRGYQRYEQGVLMSDPLAGVPLASIRVCEAAARHRSFTRAAAELGMTQAAVSWQIKALEGRLGQTLFRRLPREVALTEAGERLARAA